MKGEVVQVIEMLGRNTAGWLPALPEGIFDLRNHVADELTPPLVLAGCILATGGTPEAVAEP